MLHIKKVPARRYKIFKKYSKHSKKKCRGTAEMFKRQAMENQNVNLHSRLAVPVCDFCLHDADHNKDGIFEQMLFCADCQAKAHPSCMKYSKSLAEKALSYPWQCIECKTCTVCSTAGDAERMLFCDSCDKAYHMSCHHPEVRVKPMGKWDCSACRCSSTTIGDIVADNRDDVASIKPTPPTSRAAHGRAPNSKTARDEPIAASSRERGSSFCVDSRNWTCEDVATYFEKLGFQPQASVFLKEEIDGRTLLLLRRSDVVSGLSLKLGPALKIFDHISKLQSCCAAGHITNGPS